MNRHYKASRNARRVVIVAAVATAFVVGPTDRARAEERKFAVMLAHSPKAFLDGNGNPGLPPAGLPNVETIRKDYFDVNPLNDIDSFAEYWKEISYGDVFISGEVFSWVTLPWPFEPNGPNGDSDRPSPADYINLRDPSAMVSEAAPTLFGVPGLFSYGAGEGFCDAFTSGDNDPGAIGPDKCGALIIIDLVDGALSVPPSTRGPGMNDFDAVGMNVWTPGERFLDVDGDNRWDGIDEQNDRMCHGPNGCSAGCASGRCVGTGALCLSDGDCPDLTEITGICVLRVCNGGTNDGNTCGDDTDCPGGKCVVGGRCSSSGTLCTSNINCPTGQTCNIGGTEQLCGGPNNIFCSDADEKCGDPPGAGPRGCHTLGCGDLAMPGTDFNGDGQFSNAGNCVIPENIACSSSSQCDAVPPATVAICSGNLCPVTNCVPEGTNLPECCDQDDSEDRTDCVDGGGVDIANATRGITCGDPIVCCEFQDSNGNNSIDVVEPFEDFMIRWNAGAQSPGSVWVPVTQQYIRDNYPGDVEQLIRRTGNGYYDSPDLFVDTQDPNDNSNDISAISTKMMQDAGTNEFAFITPKPGVKPSYTAQPVLEQPWFDQWWGDRYGRVCNGGTNDGNACDDNTDCPPSGTCDSPAPAWPGGDLPSSPNSPRMRPFDPQNPVPPIVGGTEGRRWFQPNRGGFSGNGDGVEGNQNLLLSPGTDDPPFPVLPEEQFGYYDGWVEHDDLASSKYHLAGDQRLGEITSPATDTVDLPGGDAPYAAIFGVDLGTHSPLSLGNKDNFTVAAGPYAEKIHGEKGFDAGDVCIVEWLTWRTDGTSPTVAYQWELDNGPYHPFAGPRRCSDSFAACTEDADCPTGTCSVGSLGLGFRDYNLDGMIDQGEVRPMFSENYSVDSDPVTPDNGTFSVYPFNRRRLVEDVVEALDPSVDWDDFNDANAKAAVGGGPTPRNRGLTIDLAHVGHPSHDRTDIDPEGFVSGIVIVPGGSYNDNNLFPLSPGFYPIHNEDNDDDTFTFPRDPNNSSIPATVHRSFNLSFHDLVICSECRSPAPSVVPYAAHEYGHAWEHYPDLYDYDVFGDINGQLVDEENCPMGVYDLMSGARGGGLLVHFTPILKEKSGWIDPVDLTTVVTPGVETTLTLPPAELVRDESYYFIQNEDRPDERFWFWSAGSSFDQRLPGDFGMLVMHTDVQFVAEDLPLQQRTAPWTYLIVQADGRNDLQECSFEGNTGDDSDMWPGSTNAINFGRATVPPAEWNGEDAWIGLEITNIEPDNAGSVLLTLTWVPTNIPSLRFVNPPGGDSVGGIFKVTFDATDAHGGTLIELFYTPDEKKCSVAGTACSDDGDCPAGERCEHDLVLTPARKIGEINKIRDATRRLSVDWNLSGLADGRYVVFAKLTPGVGDDGIPELSSTNPRPGPANVGNGIMSVANVDIAGDTARSETWQARCIDPNGEKWLVESTVSHPSSLAQDPNPASVNCTDDLIACTGSAYTSPNGEVTFTINASSTAFTTGDTFTFVTTGLTPVSDPVIVEAERITAGPTAKIEASPLSGPPPLEVAFNATQSTDPAAAALDLDFTWDFGDGTAGEIGPNVTHTFVDAGVFSVRLTAQNPESGLSDETTVDIHVINNSPNAQFIATPASGPSPLTVQFDATGSSDTETDSADLIYDWDFGDGDALSSFGFPGRNIETTHQYDCPTTAPCTFTATLTVTDELGKQDTATFEVLVGNTRPVVVVSADPLGGPAPLTVSFNAINSSDADGDTLTVDWVWGDGEQDLNVPITGNVDDSGLVRHTYNLPNATGQAYKPTAVVKDGRGGETGWPGVDITVTGNVIPTAECGLLSPDSGIAGDAENPIVFSGTKSSDPDGSITDYMWEFGDGTTLHGLDLAIQSHVYQAAGSFTVKLTVTDDRGATATDTCPGTIEIAPDPGNRPPVALIATGVRMCTAPCTLSFNGSLSADPDGDVLTHDWEFRFQDVACVSNAACPINFTCDFASAQCVSTASGPAVNQQFQTIGNYTVQLTVTDEDGVSSQSGAQNIRILVGGAIPVEPGTGQPVPGQNGEILDSARQRPPQVCGLGIVMMFFGSLFGLFSMAVSRRRLHA